MIRRKIIIIIIITTLIGQWLPVKEAIAKTEYVTIKGFVERVNK